MSDCNVNTYCPSNLGEIWPQRINTTLSQGTKWFHSDSATCTEVLHSLALLPDKCIWKQVAYHTVCKPQKWWRSSAVNPALLNCIQERWLITWHRVSILIHLWPHPYIPQQTILIQSFCFCLLQVINITCTLTHSPPLLYTFLPVAPIPSTYLIIIIIIINIFSISFVSHKPY